MHLTEADARGLAQHVVTELRLLGALVTSVTVSRNHDGLLFLTEINGHLAGCQVPPGTVAYRTVALELLHNALTARAVGAA